MSEDILKKDTTSIDPDEKAEVNTISDEDIINQIEESNMHGVTKQQIIGRIIEYRGPIPDPLTLEHYEKILPGSAEKILNMAMDEQKFRHDFDKKLMQIESRDSLLGEFFAFVLGIGCLIAGVLLAKFNPNSTGVVFGALLGMSGIGSIAVAIVRWTRTSWKKEHSDN